MTPINAVEQWSRISERYGSLDVLRRAIYKGNLREPIPRSLLWRCLLVYGNYNEHNWSLTQRRNHKRYLKLLDEYPLEVHMNGINGKNDHETPISDPLTEPSVDTSELIDIITKDVERTFPEIDLFRDPEVSLQLKRILYVYSRQNPVVGYRQGMHELAGLVLWVLIHDEYSDDKQSILHKMYTESDTFCIFESIMKYAEDFYRPAKEMNDVPSIVFKSQKIYDNILRIVDPDLYEHLLENNIEPQIFTVRWMRLLFSREFPFNRVLPLWDSIFAADSTLSIVDYICVAMLLKVHDKLLQSSTNEILTCLLNYPSSASIDVHDLVVNALYLRTNCTPEAGKQVRTHFGEKLTRSPQKHKKSKSNFSIDAIYDAAKSVSGTLHKTEECNDQDRQQRDGLLSQLISKSIISLESMDENMDSGNHKDGINEVIRNLRLVHGCLVDPSSSISSISEALSSPLSKRYITKLEAKQNGEIKQYCETTQHGESKQYGEPKQYDDSPKEQIDSPVRISLAQSNFSWMLNSPEPRGSSTQFRQTKPRSEDQSNDLFELL